MSAPASPQQRTPVQNLGLVLGPLLSVGVLLWFDLDPNNPAVGRMAAVVVLMATWWVTEAIPLAATSLLPMVMLPTLGISAGRDVAGSYMNPIIFLFIGGFLIALAMERWNLHRRIALTIINAIGRKADWLILGFMLASAFLSMWISNTATAVMMLPIGLAIIGQLEREFGKEKTHPMALALLLSIAYSCSIGGVATPVGTPTNLALIKIFEDTFPAAPPITFGQWVLVGIPLATILIFTTWVVLTKFACKLDQSLIPDRSIVQKELKELGPLSFEERAVTVVWITTALLWVFRSDLNIGSFSIPGWRGLWDGFALMDDSTIAILMALVLFIIPAGAKTSRKALLEIDAFKNLPWAAILLFGGGFALANGFTGSGLTQNLATRFGELGAMPIFLTIILVCLAITLVTELVSNVATVQMFIPVLAAWAVAQNTNPLLFMVPATIMSSMAFLMPVGTPPNAVIFGSERIRIAEMIKVGIWVELLAFTITILLALWLVPTVFEIDPGIFPSWARP